MALWCEWFFRYATNNVRTRGIKLILCGGPGTGKTASMRRVWQQCARRAVDAALTDGWRGRFPWTLWLDWEDLTDNRQDQALQDTLYELASAEIVFIDDVGSEADKFKGGEPAARLRRVLQECSKKWLMVTTNLSRDQFLDQYDARVADRLSAAHWCDMSEVPSYRPKLADQMRRAAS